MNTPKISIIMPVYNSGSYLKTAVDSILNQSFREIELILVDDGSTDGSPERCDEYARKDSRVVVIHQKNGGICNARNAALKIAKGEYIGFADHDDEFVQYAFETAYDAAKENDADIVKFRKYVCIFKDGKFVRSKTNHFQSQVFEKEDIVKHLFYLKNVNILNCVWDGIFKKELFKTICFDENYKNGGEDIAVMYDMIIVIEKLVLIDKVFYKHYIRRGFSTSTKFNMNNIQSTKSLALHMNNVLTKLGINKMQNQIDYVFYLLQFVYFPVIEILSNDECRLSINEKKRIIADMLNAEYTPDYFFKQPVKAIYAKSKKIALGYFLFRHSLYKLLFLMFNIRLKNS